KTYLPNLPDIDRYAISDCDHDILNVTQIFHQPFPPNKIRLVYFLDISTSGNAVVLFQRGYDIMGTDTKRIQFLGFQSHFVLLQVPTPGINLYPPWKTG